MRSLSVDFVNMDQLQDLHTQCLATAKLYDSHLIVKYPSDFFQVELSYPYIKDNLVLVLSTACTYGSYRRLATIDALLIIPNSSLERGLHQWNYPQIGSKHSLHLQR